LLRAQKRAAPLPIVLSVVSQMLSGLHAAHEATSPRGDPLHLVHRDVSPQNVVVGTDGVARVLDFGVAKATWRTQDTRDGSLKGKLAYMSPEQLMWRKLDRRSDIFAASVVLWEALTGERLFAGESTEETVQRILSTDVPNPSTRGPKLPAGLDAIVGRGLAREASERFATAHDMAVALDAIQPHATVREVGAWVTEIAKDALAKRAQMVRELENMRFESQDDGVPPRLVRALEPSRGASEPTGAGQSLPLPPSIPVEVTSVTNSGLSAPVSSSSFARTWRRWGMGVGAAALLVVAAVAVVARHRSERPVIAAAPVSPAPSASDAPSAASSAPSVALEIVSTPSASTEAPAPKPSPAKTRAAKGSSCDPPYTVEKDGIRRYKPECI
jgi:eukaryotic-like serine/threonine-protein kinase